MAFLFYIAFSYFATGIMKKIIITIDGWSSCGKSTLAKQLAKALGYVYVDSGGFNGFWRFLDPDTYTNWGYTIPEFNSPTTAITSDVYDIYFHGLCFVGSTRLSAYG